MNLHEHKFMADFQPIGSPTASFQWMIISSMLNWLALFGVFFVIGRALKLGLGD
jgi:hypothetical protein